MSNPAPKPSSREERGGEICASKGDVCLCLVHVCSPWTLELSHGEGRIAASFRDCHLQVGCPPRRQPPQDRTGGAAVVDFQRLRCNTTSCLLFFCLGMLLSYFAHFLQALLRSFFSPIGIVHGPTRRRSRTPFGGEGDSGGSQKCKTCPASGESRLAPNIESGGQQDDGRWLSAANIYF